MEADWSSNEYLLTEFRLSCSSISVFDEDLLLLLIDPSIVFKGGAVIEVIDV